MLFDQSLAVFDAVEVGKVILVIDLGSSQESIGVLFISTVGCSFLKQHLLLLVAFSLDLESPDSNLKQLVLPLSIQGLLVIKLLLFGFKFLLLLLHLDFLKQLLLLLLVVKSIFPHLVDGHLQL